MPNLFSDWIQKHQEFWEAYLNIDVYEFQIFMQIAELRGEYGNVLSYSEASDYMETVRKVFSEFMLDRSFERRKLLLLVSYAYVKWVKTQ